MGITSLIDVEDQIKIYKKYKSSIFQSNGKAQPCSHDIYVELIKELEGMNAKSIQTSINRNKNKILNDNEVSKINFNNRIRFIILVYLTIDDV